MLTAVDEVGPAPSGHRRNRRAFPRVRLRPPPAVHIDSQAGGLEARLHDATPHGLGLGNLSGALPAVGSRVQVAFGLGRWSIRRRAEVRRHHQGYLGLSLGDPLPEGLRAALVDLRFPQLGRVDDAYLDGTSAFPGVKPTIRRAWRDRAGQRIDAPAVVGHVSVAPWFGGTWIARPMLDRLDHPLASQCRADLLRFGAMSAVYASGDRTNLLVVCPAAGGDWTLIDAFVDWLGNPALATSLRWSRELPRPGEIPATCLIPARSATEWQARAVHQLGPLAIKALGWTDASAHPEHLFRVFRFENGPEAGFVVVDARVSAGFPLDEKPNAIAWWIAPDNVVCPTEALRGALSRWGFQGVTLVRPGNPSGDPQPGDGPSGAPAMGDPPSGGHGSRTHSFVISASGLGFLEDYLDEFGDHDEPSSLIRNRNGAIGWP